ncbi:DUF4123 domain-containing protein, partial [Xanthomonas oryzae pv. oryzae]
YYLQDLPHRSLFARQPEAEHADLGPWLVQLPEFGQAPIEGWLRALELGHPAVAWLASAGDFDAVFDHLETCLDLRRPNGTLALLRYWDGRVFVRLQRILTANQRLQLLGPIARWRTRVLGEDVVVSLSATDGQEHSDARDHRAAGRLAAVTRSLAIAAQARAGDTARSWPRGGAPVAPGAAR